MDVEKALQRLRVQNFGRIPIEDFGRVWTDVERRSAAGGAMDYHLVGALRTLRWLGRASIETPVTRVTSTVLPEVCETEWLLALRATRSTDLHPSRVETARGTVAVLGWLYHGQREPYSATSAYDSAASGT